MSPILALTSKVELTKLTKVSHVSSSGIDLCSSAWKMKGRHSCLDVGFVSKGKAAFSLMR